MKPRMRPTSPLVLWAILLPACHIDDAVTTTCSEDHDCNPGRVCVAGMCQGQSDGPAPNRGDAANPDLVGDRDANQSNTDTANKVDTSHDVSLDTSTEHVALDGPGADAPHCGDANEPCCDGWTCGSTGLACSLGTCLPCGHSGEPCCLARTCSQGGTACSIKDSTCKPCGAVGSICCYDKTSPCVFGGACLVPEGAPAGSDAECLPCGGSNQMCCAGQICDSKSGCNINVNPQKCTEPCGGLNQPCCGVNTCSAPNTFCSVTRNLICIDQCGDLFQPCCPGSTCTATGAACKVVDEAKAVSECITCGGEGQPCCAIPARYCYGLQCQGADPGVCVKP